MKKYITTIITLVVVFALAGCGQSTDSVKPASTAKSKTAEEVTEITGNLEEVKTAIIQKLALEGTMAIELDAACGIYTLDENDIKDFAAFTMMEGTFPHEVVMIEAQNADAAKRIETALGVRLDSFREQSKGYSPEDYALAQKCKVEVSGNSVAMFLSPKCDEMKSIYEESIK